MTLIIAKYNNRLKKDLKGFLTAPKSEKTFFALSIIPCHHLRKRLKIQAKSTTSPFFVNGFNISNIRLATTKPVKYAIPYGVDIVVFENKRVDINYSQFVQVYIRIKFIYSFNTQKTFEVGYMIENNKSNQEYRQDKEKSIS